MNRLVNRNNFSILNSNKIFIKRNFNTNNKNLEEINESIKLSIEELKSINKKSDNNTFTLFCILLGITTTNFILTKK